ncbi:MAG: hypothetical protein ABIO70_10000 [Pseudomonadota bacterium]
MDDVDREILRLLMEDEDGLGTGFGTMFGSGAAGGASSAISTIAGGIASGVAEKRARQALSRQRTAEIRAGQSMAAQQAMGAPIVVPFPWNTVILVGGAVALVGGLIVLLTKKDEPPQRPA